MKKEDVKIASVYAIKFGKNTVGIRIMSAHPHGGWLGTVISTGKSMHITSADRLCGPFDPKATEEAGETAQILATPNQTPAAAGESASKGGGLKAAIRVLEEAGTPLRCKDMVKWMLAKGYWTTQGKTPEATISSAITREIKEKGAASRFRKTDRGMFTINS